MKGNLHVKIDWAGLVLRRKFTVFLCFTPYLRVISKFKSSGGAYIWRGVSTEGFLRYDFIGLIFRGAYTWRGLFSEFYGNSLRRLSQIKEAAILNKSRP